MVNDQIDEPLFECIFISDSSNPGLEYLRDLVLVDYADQLRNQVLETESVIHSR